MAQYAGQSGQTEADLEEQKIRTDRAKRARDQEVGDNDSQEENIQSFLKAMRPTQEDLDELFADQDIDEWLDWYQGDVPNFHTYKIYNGVVTTEQKRYRLGMAKKVCEDWANLMLNEKVSITAGDYEGRLADILQRNNFQVRGNQLVEMAFALGTAAFVEYRDGDGNVVSVCPVFYRRSGK